MKWEYPAISEDGVDLLLITHEHVDHNGVDAIGGDPAIVRSTAGRLESPIGEVLGIASEHDDAAGTERGPNTIFAFDLDGVRVAHFGDFGQRELRPEQAAALEGIDLLFLPAGGADDRRKRSRRDRRGSAATLGRADALPHPRIGFLGNRGGVPRRRAACREAPAERF